MWKDYSRERCLEELQEPFDLIVIGGGITGAGVLREAARAGLRCCLLEGRDFAWGTSSWSSKMIHGGLRYLTEGDIKLTLEAVRERNHLLREFPDLITPLGFIFAFYKGQKIQKHLLQTALLLYDLLALQWKHGTYGPQELLQKVPGLKSQDLISGLHFQDALTDDTRLVLAVLRQALAFGGVPLSYCSVGELLQEEGQTCGVRALDRISGESLEVRGRAVINATGVWADRICSCGGDSLPLRPLRGSHLVLPASTLRVPCAVTFMHPEDERPVFAFPWGQVTVAGTTDLDHEEDLDQPARISPRERDYLQKGLQSVFPSLSFSSGDILSTFSGVRPVVGGTRENPSQEPRRHVVRDHHGLITVTGGKLTTFRLLARDALKQAEKYLGPLNGPGKDHPVPHRPAFDLPSGHGFSEGTLSRLAGILGSDIHPFLSQAAEEELTPVGDSDTLWAELRWSLRHEAVCHLEDLMLRRSNLGLILPRGGEHYLEDILGLCSRELGWSEARMRQEREDYLRLWREYYSPCPGSEPSAQTLES
ncbi:MAG: glycerol-3-phosphate dehydrogenase/oxidase [Desulfohalobiaceae bacterium]|nr:glycerol-3-phosphate dehydrogenase/oxidase [Desulfohalobiaceae bacterium]